MNKTLRHTLALLIVLGSAACSSSDTIVALNVASAAEVGSVDTLHVTITQPGQPPFEQDIVPPTVPVDGGAPVINPAFFQRLTLPDGWKDGSAELKLDAKNAAGKQLSVTATFDVREEGAVAVYVMLGQDPPPAPVDAGAEDAGN